MFLGKFVNIYTPQHIKLRKENWAPGRAIRYKSAAAYCTLQLRNLYTQCGFAGFSLLSLVQPRYHFPQFLTCTLLF